MNEHKELEKALNIALDKLYDADSYLIENALHEQCIVFRFGLYLYEILRDSERFSGLNLDIEYNKKLGDAKIIPNCDNGVRPDLLLHERGNNNKNTLVLEFKKGNSQEVLNDDVKKIKAFMNPQGEYKYKYGATILFTKTRTKSQIKWIEISNSNQIKPINRKVKVAPAKEIKLI